MKLESLFRSRSGENPFDLAFPTSSPSRTCSAYDMCARNGRFVHNFRFFRAISPGVLERIDLRVHARDARRADSRKHTRVCCDTRSNAGSVTASCLGAESRSRRARRDFHRRAGVTDAESASGPAASEICHKNARAAGIMYGNIYVPAERWGEK